MYFHCLNHAKGFAWMIHLLVLMLSFCQGRSVDDWQHTALNSICESFRSENRGALWSFVSFHSCTTVVGFSFCWNATRWQDTLQIILQLSEPGTVWCQNLSFTSAGPTWCQRCKAVCSVLRSSSGDRERIYVFSILPWGWDLVGSFSALLLGNFCEGLSVTRNQLFASCSWSLHLHWSGDESYLEKKHDLWRSPSSGLHQRERERERERERQRPKMQATVWIQYLQVLM